MFLQQTLSETILLQSNFSKFISNFFRIEIKSEILKEFSSGLLFFGPKVIFSQNNGHSKILKKGQLNRDRF